ncbi:MAG: hypothetical protein IBX69_18930 [Anaerolineales bacterium]|nr:hypothetical protein [Anaerolineales bacterium]
MIWYKKVIDKLQASTLFREVNLVGGKVRAHIDDTRFVDIHFDPTSGSYSYALIDLSLPFSGDKRLFGWDDYPHESAPIIKELSTFPHHFQKRSTDGTWVFEPSPMRGNIEQEVDTVIAAVKDHIPEA